MKSETVGTRAAARVRARRLEIEQAALIRVHEVSHPERADAVYSKGLEAAVSVALDYGIESLERGEEGPPPVPEALLAQARLAARSGVSLDTVLRRYFAGFSLFADFLMREAEIDGSLNVSALHTLQRTQAIHLDRLMAAIGEAHTREREERQRSPERRRAEGIARLLAGQLPRPGELAYDFDGWHVALVAVGSGFAQAIRQAAREVDRRPLMVHHGEDTAWAWFGAKREVTPEELERLRTYAWPAASHVAIGEPGDGLAGWRLSHRQAEAALPIALHGQEESAVRYADVALVASIVNDDLLNSFLRRTYVEPLEPLSQ